jgi:hypothetical protein
MNRPVIECQVIEVNHHAMLELGIEMMGFSKNTIDGMKIERFRASFGMDPIACSIVFHDLQTVDIGIARIQTIDPYFFLMTLFWLRNYVTNIVMTGIFHIDGKTLTKWIWTYAHGIRALKNTKVRN